MHSLQQNKGQPSSQSYNNMLGGISFIRILQSEAACCCFLIVIYVLVLHIVFAFLA